MEVGVVGGSGYGGGELVRLLEHHPGFKLRTVAARKSAGRPLGDVFPNLAGSPAGGMVLTLPEPDAFAGSDVVFLATPREASRELVPALLAAGACVVDFSDAFRLAARPLAHAGGGSQRLTDAAGTAAPAGTTAPAGTAAPADPTAPTAADTNAAPAQAAYGLPELYRDHLDGARLVANPGCYPTAGLLALAPLAGLVDPASVTVVGMSGTSGAGRGLRDDLHASHAIGNIAAYGAPTHRHTPEITAGWGALVRGTPAVTFVPHLVPTVRGLVCTVTASLIGDPDAVRPAYERVYEAEPFVALLPEGAWPAATHVAGGNGAHVGVAVDLPSARVVASCAIDNLVKGAAGQALQCANALLGLDETTGLTATGTYP